VSFFLMRQVPLRRQKQNIIYPHVTEICGYSLVTVFLVKVR
jgi:hypothetical protein